MPKAQLDRFIDSQYLPVRHAVGVTVRAVEPAEPVIPASPNFSLVSTYAELVATLAACTGGEKILIAPGIYTGNVTVADNYISLVGSGAPFFDAPSGRLVGGTIIRGKIVLGTTIGSIIRDLGVDLVGIDGEDCIASSTLNGIRVERSYENLTLLGNGYDALAHGILAGGNTIQIHNCRIYYCYHGIAVHGSYDNISNCYFYACGGTSLILKAKESGGISGTVRHVNVSNIIIEGNPAVSFETYGGPLVLQTEDADALLDHIQITNVSADYTVNGILWILRNGAQGTIADISLNNMSSDHDLSYSGIGDYWFVSGTRVFLTNCHTTNRTDGYGFQINSSDDVGDIYLIACSSDDTGSGATNANSEQFARLEINGNVMPGYKAVTIATGAISATSRRMRVDTEAAAASDDLDTINGGVDGQLITLRTTSSSRDIVIKHNTGNIHSALGDKTLGNRSDRWHGEYDDITGFWEQLSYSDNL